MTAQLDAWEVRMIKGMLDTRRWNKQEILSYFSFPGRSVNPARIGEIENSHPRFGRVLGASRDEVLEFVEHYPTDAIKSYRDKWSDRLTN